MIQSMPNIHIKAQTNKEFPPRNGGKVTIIAEGQVNPGQVSGDGKSVVFGEFKPTEGETVHRWRKGESIQLNQDGYSSYQARCNDDASVVAFHRYSLQNASDRTGNWDIGRWQDGKVEVIANSPWNEGSPSINDSGTVIVYDNTDPKTKLSTIMKWKDGTVEAISNGEFVDWFPEVSGNGERVLWRRGLEQIHMQDQMGTVKPLPFKGQHPAGVTIDKAGDKILYMARDEGGEEDLFLTDLKNSKTTTIAGLKNVDEYQGDMSADGRTIVYTAIDRRKEESDMNVFLWQDGKTQQLTWNDGGMNFSPSVSDDGNSIAWLWMDHQDTNNRKILLWEKDKA
jgi:WD40-like Beta Propeller Repeat